MTSSPDSYTGCRDSVKLSAQARRTCRLGAQVLMTAVRGSCRFQALSNATIPEISITCNESIGVDTGLSILLQFEIRQGEVFVRIAPPGPRGTYLCPESKRESGRRDYETRVFCSRVGTFDTWQATARSYPSYRGLCSSRISSSRLFFRFRFRGQLRPHGVESGQLQRSEVRSRRHEGALPKSPEGGQRDQRADGQPSVVRPRSCCGVRH